MGSKRICEVYKEADEKWVKEGVKTISTDEKTGIQALERNAPDLGVRAGKNRKIEYASMQCWIATVLLPSR